jgi:hypothetical protein
MAIEDELVAHPVQRSQRIIERITGEQGLAFGLIDVRLAQLDPGADDEASLEFTARPIELGGPFDRAEETGALIAGMQIEMIGHADLRQALRQRAEALLDDRGFAIAREMRVQMIIVWIHGINSF